MNPSDLTEADVATILQTAVTEDDFGGAVRYLERKYSISQDEAIHLVDEVTSSK
jgi:hypothetical protein